VGNLGQVTWATLSGESGERILVLSKKKIRNKKYTNISPAIVG